MFENLLESKAKKQRTFGQTLMSVGLHGLIIFGAVKATQSAAESVKDKPIDTTMVFLKPPEAPPPPNDPPPPEKPPPPLQPPPEPQLP